MTSTWYWYLPSDPDAMGRRLSNSEYGVFAGATLLMALRLYVRLFMRQTFGWDDFFIILSYLTAAFGCVMIQLAVNAGYSHYFQDLHPDQVETVQLMIALCGIVSPLGIGLVKVSLIIFVLRLFGKAPKARWIKWVCYADLIVFVPPSLACFFLFCFQCTPLQVAWKENYPPDKCVGREVLTGLSAATSVVATVSDFMTSVLPVMILKNLKIDRSLKYLLCTLTGLGVFVTLFSILRTLTTFHGYRVGDSARSSVPMALWLCVEHNVGIMVACLPACSPLFITMIRRITTGISSLQTKTTSWKRLSIQITGPNISWDPDSDYYEDHDSSGAQTREISESRGHAVGPGHGVAALVPRYEDHRRSRARTVSDVYDDDDDDDDVYRNDGGRGRDSTMIAPPTTQIPWRLPDWDRLQRA